MELLDCLFFLLACKCKQSELGVLVSLPMLGRRGVGVWSESSIKLGMDEMRWFEFIKLFVPF
jgi:hypothetical protein